MNSKIVSGIVLLIAVALLFGGSMGALAVKPAPEPETTEPWTYLEHETSSGSEYIYILVDNDTYTACENWIMGYVGEYESLGFYFKVYRGNWTELDADSCQAWVNDEYDNGLRGSILVGDDFPYETKTYGNGPSARTVPTDYDYWNLDDNWVFCARWYWSNTDINTQVEKMIDWIDGNYTRPDAAITYDDLDYGQDNTLGNVVDDAYSTVYAFYDEEDTDDTNYESNLSRTDVDHLLHRSHSNHTTYGFFDESIQIQGYTTNVEVEAINVGMRWVASLGCKVFDHSISDSIAYEHLEGDYVISFWGNSDSVQGSEDYSEVYYQLGQGDTLGEATAEWASTEVDGNNYNKGPVILGDPLITT